MASAWRPRTDARSSQWGWLRPRPWESCIGWAVAVVAGSAALFAIPSPVHFSAAPPRAAIESLIAASALLGVALLASSLRQRQERGDLLLLAALATAGLADFLSSALPALTGSELLGFGSATQVTCDALAALAIAAAALTPTDTRALTDRRTLGVAGLLAASAVAIALVVDLLGGKPAFGGAMPGAGIAAAAQRPVPMIECIASTTVLLVSGVAFLRRPERTTRLLAGAAFVFAAARLQYLALPAMAPSWVTARDGLRLVAFALLLMVALRRYGQTRREFTAAKLAAERDRIARDLHDGLAQDLAYIALQGQRLSTELGADHPLTVAARRAVAASRDVIIDLAASAASSTDAALREVADELAVRFAINVDVRILNGLHDPPSDELDPASREQLVRIAREAIVNAARHGEAHRVAVVFDRTGEQLQLRVSDDGHGTEHTRLRARNGHGLHMMRARAVALDGEMIARRSANAGVEVEVTFPRAGHAIECR